VDRRRHGRQEHRLVEVFDTVGHLNADWQPLITCVARVSRLTYEKDTRSGLVPIPVGPTPLRKAWQINTLPAPHRPTGIGAKRYGRPVRRSATTPARSASTPRPSLVPSALIGALRIGIITFAT
jgi:hypothetical protein